MAELPTRWIGVWERFNIGVYMVWVVVGITLWRVPESAGLAIAGPRSEVRAESGALVDQA